MFSKVQEAKIFLVTQIAAQAQRDGMPLSATEEKMLYFSETDWTLPDIWDVNAAFERDYDAAQYEGKIADLIRRFREYARNERPADLTSWNEAVRILRKGDHYLLVMVDIASSSSSGPTSVLRLLLMGVVGFVVLATCLIIFMSLR